MTWIIVIKYGFYRSKNNIMITHCGDNLQNLKITQSQTIQAIYEINHMKIEKKWTIRSVDISVQIVILM